MTSYGKVHASISGITEHRGSLGHLDEIMTPQTFVTAAKPDVQPTTVAGALAGFREIGEP